MGITSNN